MLEVHISGTPANIQFSIFEPGGIFDFFQSRASVGSVAVSPYPMLHDEVWKIEGSVPCRFGASQFRYAVVPGGFVERVAPRPLTAETLYSVWVEECGGLGRDGVGYFKIASGRIQNVSWQDVP